MTTNVPKFPLISIFCAKVGSMPYYMRDECERAASVKAARDTYSAGIVNGDIVVKRWRDIRNEAFKDELARACEIRYGVHPRDLVE